MVRLAAFAMVSLLGIALLSVELIQRAGANADLQPGKVAVVAAEKANLMLGQKVIAILDRGARMEITAVEGNWIGGEVVVGRRKRYGWIQKRYLKEAQPASPSSPPGAGSENTARSTPPKPEEQRPAEPGMPVAAVAPVAETKPASQKPAEKVPAESAPKQPAAPAAKKAASPQPPAEKPPKSKPAPAAKNAADDAKTPAPPKSASEPKSPPKVAPVPSAPRQKFTIEILVVRNAAEVAKISPEERIGKLVLLGSTIDTAALKQLDGLTIWELSIEGVRVGNAGLRHLEKVKGLRSLCLWSAEFSDAALAHVASLGDLEKLDLEGTSVRGDGLKHLAGLKKLRALTLGPGTDDAALKHLKALPALERLDLRSCRKLTDEATEALGQLARLKTLLLPSQLSPEVKKKLAEKLPNCQLLR